MQWYVSASLWDLEHLISWLLNSVSVKSYMWYMADGDISQQQTALMVSRIPFLTKPEKERTILNGECLKVLLAAPGKGKTEIRDTTIMIVLDDSAIRLSKLLNLKLSDVNLQRKTPYLRIHGKGDKERIVSISNNAVKHLKYYINLYHSVNAPVTEYLFYTVIHDRTSAMSPGNVEHIVNKYAEMIRSEHPDMPAKVHPHMFSNPNFPLENL